MLLGLGVVISVTGCVLAPLASGGSDADGEASSSAGIDAAHRVLAQVVRQVVRDDTGSFESELIFGEGQMTWGGQYGIRATRARLQKHLQTYVKGANTAIDQLADEASEH